MMEVQTTTTLSSLDNASEDCITARTVLACIGDKWSIAVMVVLGAGPVRFNTIKRMMPGISQRVLAITLRDLERNGFLTREVVPTRLPQVHYDLTELGRAFRDTLVPLAVWLRNHADRIRSAQVEYSKD